MSHLDTAYKLGAEAAQRQFNKELDKLSAFGNREPMGAMGGRIALPQDPTSSLAQSAGPGLWSRFKNWFSNSGPLSSYASPTTQPKAPAAAPATQPTAAPALAPASQPQVSAPASTAKPAAPSRMFNMEAEANQPLAGLGGSGAHRAAAKSTATARTPQTFNMEAEANQPLAGLGGSGAQRPSAKPAAPRARPRPQTSYADLADEGYTPRNAGEVKARQQFMAELAPKPKASPAVASVTGGIGRAGGAAQSVNPSAVAIKEAPPPRMGGSSGSKPGLDSLLPPGSKL